MKISKLCHRLLAPHQIAIKKHPLIHFVAFSIITFTFGFLAIYIGILNNQPLVAFLSGFFGGLSARDAWVSYEIWRPKR
ncbi:MAG: hypothetical protein HWN68_10795 [Desulfobacterales bacterium]|nr:hypothetical protein [Desulfobacterales bacterium]